MEKIYRFYANQCYGELSGIFVSTEEDIKSLYGKTIEFGEIMGKHSEVEETLDEDYFEVVTDDPKAVEIFEKYNMATGTNPFDYPIYEE